MESIKLLMVAPIPPPYGGIANWTELMRKKIKEQSAVSLVDLLNIAPKRRGLDGRTLYERVVVQGREMFKTARELKKALKKNPPDVVHITTSGQLAIIRDIKLLKICKAKKIRSVYHVRFGRAAEIAAANTLEWKLFKKAVKLSSVTLAIDESTANTLQEKGFNNVEKIANPFDLSTLSALPTTEPKKEIMFLGWCVKTKGIEELLLAWEHLSEKYQGWQLRIVGPCQEEYLQKLKTEFLCKNVLFEGEKTHEEAMALLNEAEIFILPSHTEGFPNVVLEAMALGKSIVATDVGAIKEMLSENSGLVIPKKNIAAVEQALKSLLDDAVLRETVAKNAYERVRREYAIDSIFEKYKTIWRGGEK